MSSQWEVVEHRRKDKSKKDKDDNVALKPNKKKSHQEEQSKKVIQQNASDKSNKDSSPKQRKQNDNKKSEKGKVPKNLEEAMSGIEESELKEACDSLSLSDVARFVNSKLTVDHDDETYSQRSFDYPLSILPPSLRRCIEKAIYKEAKNTSIHYCVEFCLSSIAYIMAKDSPVTGYKLMIQLIAKHHPEQFLKCTSKVSTLMSSFRNRPNIGLSLLWAVGQAGYRELSVGVQVWKETMLPLFQMKNYYSHVMTYLVNLLGHHENSSAAISSDDFLSVFFFIHGNKRTLSKESERLLRAQSPLLRSLYFSKSDSWKSFNFMDVLLDELPVNYAGDGGACDPKSEEILRCVVDALSVNPVNFAQWERLHPKYHRQSTHVLAHIYSNWKSIEPRLRKKPLRDSLHKLTALYKDMLEVKTRNADIMGAVEICEKVKGKMTDSKGFPWKTSCFVLLLAVLGALVYLDVTRAGSYPKSETAKYVKVGGEYAQIATRKTLSVSARGYKWAETNVPQYWADVAEFTRPYVKLGCDLIKIACGLVTQLYNNVAEIFSEKWPTVVTFTDTFIPGLTDLFREASNKILKPIKDSFMNFFANIATYLKTNVFIDNWAPEELHNKTMYAFNTTRLYATEYYKWFYKHVDEYSKL